jgi:RimJ/RimL family protein N-acetyltransferase
VSRERAPSDALVEPLPPALLPARAPIEGRYVRVEPVDPRVHAEELFAAAHQDAAVWDYLAYGPWPSPASFRDFLRDCAASADPVFYAIRDRATGRASGVASLMSIVPKNGTIEIGHIWLGPALQNTTAATEALYRLIDYALTELGYRRMEWKCNALNAASRRAAVRLGFYFEGIFYQHMIAKGRNRDTAWFSILDSEWPALRATYEAWLAPDNFDESGRQRTSLRELNWRDRQSRAPV